MFSCGQNEKNCVRVDTSQVFAEYVLPSSGCFALRFHDLVYLSYENPYLDQKVAAFSLYQTDGIVIVCPSIWMRGPACIRSVPGGSSIRQLTVFRRVRFRCSE